MRMTNTFALYDAMSDFRKAQIASRETYLQKKKRIDPYAGSTGYEDDLKKIREERNQANAAACAACKAKIDPIFKAMHEANAKRGITAPSEEAIRILTAVKMLEKPSKTFLDVVANSLEGNGLALAVLDQIARGAWENDPDPNKRWTPSYEASSAAKELNPQYAAKAIKALQASCNEILNGSGANRVRERGADRNMRVHGMAYDPDDLPQEQEYLSEKDFYKREGFADYELFAAAVN